MHKLDIQRSRKQRYTVQIVIGHDHQLETRLFHTRKPFNQFRCGIRSFGTDKRIIQISYNSTVALSVQLFQIYVKTVSTRSLGINILNKEVTSVSYDTLYHKSVFPENAYSACWYGKKEKRTGILYARSALSSLRSFEAVS